jgi:cobalt-zinc-cadmium efflux system outer membrane protein
LTEDEVVARISANPALESIVQGKAGLARAAALEATKLSNLEVGYSREQVFGKADAADDYLTVSQTLPLSGSRGMRLRAAEIRAKAAEQSGLLARAQLIGRARGLFFETLMMQRRAEAIQSWVERLSKALAIVESRERSGDAATYELIRLERELTTARSQVALEQAATRRQRGVLAGLLRLDDQGFLSAGRVDGSLLPQEGLPTVDILLAQLERRPDVLALAEQFDAARLEERAAKRGWIPSLTIEGGYRSAGQDDLRAHGYVAGVALTLPFFDHDQSALRQAAAEQRIVTGRKALLLQQARGIVTGLHGEVLSLTELAVRFREECETARQGLVRSVEAAYRGDEATLLELLDAYQGVLDDELHGLELEMAARRARIDLDVALGRVQP